MQYMSNLGLTVLKGYISTESMFAFKINPNLHFLLSSYRLSITNNRPKKYYFVFS
jgi:hypothetical protein